MTPIKESDWPLFQRLHSDPEIIALCFNAPDEQQLKEKFASRLPDWGPDKEHWLCLVIRNALTAQPLGITGFALRHGIAEVGYLLLPEFYGRQLGTETLQAVIHWAHKQHQISQYSATVTEGNIASERVLEKCGFTLNNVIPDAYEIGGKRYADKIYSLQL